MRGGLRAIVIVVSIFAVTLVLLPPHLFAMAFQLRVRKRIPVLWHRATLWCLGMKLRILGTPADGRHGVLMAANHISWIDIVALGSVAPVSFIAKADVREWPLFGRLARWQDTVFISREKRSAAGKQVNAIRARLDNGDTLVLFAEGTTSDGNYVDAFKSALFGAVGITGERTDMHRFVQPVAIAYTGWHGLPMGRFDRPFASWAGDIELGPHLWRILREGALDIDVMFGSPIHVTPDMDRKALCAACEASVRRMMAFALRGRLPSSNTDAIVLHRAYD